MAAKDTTAQLKKNIFWILSGLGVFLTLLTGILTLIFVGGAVSEKAAANDKELADIKAVQPKGTKAIADMGQQQEVIGKVKVNLWEKSWEKQRSLLKWPSDSQGRLAGFEQLYQKFGEPIAEVNAEFSTFKRPEVYEAAYAQLADSIKPTQFRGSWQQVLRYVGNWGDKNPTAAQIWLALEDLWVQTAALKPITAINAAVTSFKPLPDKDNNPLKRSFENRVWRVALEVPTEGPEANKQFKVSLTNRTERLQAFGRNSTLTLNVYLSEKSNAAPVRIRLQRSYVKAGETYDAAPNPLLLGIPPSTLVEKIARVELVPDSKNVPVRQVRTVELGKLDARHASAALKPPAAGVFASAAAAAEAQVAAGPGGPDGAGGMSMMGGMSRMMGQGGTGAAAAGGTPETVLDANLKRYIDITEQVRRRPVAIVLVLDQMYLQDALAAYANSDLRFQVTQFHWKRFREAASSLGAPDDEVPPGQSNAPGGPPGGPSGGPPGGYGGKGGLGGMMPGLGGSMGGGFGSSGEGGVGGFGGPGSPANAISDAQATSGLVELSIYGIVTLYEKFEDKPATATPATPATPAK